MEEKRQQEEHNTSEITLLYVCGLPFPMKFKEENVLSAINYTPLDDDIIISSFPKTGTTWVQYIVLQMVRGTQCYPSFRDLNFKEAPYMELVGAEAVSRLEPPRIIKSHLPYNLTPRSKSAKYICTIRNPKDTVVSFYKFGLDMGSYCVSFDKFFACFLKGEVGYGDYFEHVLSWYDHRDDDNILLLHYEELCRDVRTQILRIAKFLGASYLTALEEDPGLLERIIQNTSFNHMKQNLHFKLTSLGFRDPFKDSDAAEKPVNFFRKGTPGDWRNNLSAEQSRLLDEKIYEKLGKTELISLWRDII